MKKLQATSIIFLLFSFIAFSLTIVSCRKDHNYEGTITVVDTLSNTIEGATVVISSDNSKPSPNGNPFLGEISKTGTTGSSGTYKFSIKYPAVLKVVATKDSLVGTGIIKIEENKMGKSTITVRYL